MDKLQAKINKKILLLSLATATPMKLQEPWTESQNTMNNLAQITYESISNLNSKSWFAGGFA
jgi:hypothetical protein